MTNYPPCLRRSIVRKSTQLFTQIVLGSVATIIAVQPALAEGLQVAQLSNGGQKPMVPNPSVSVNDAPVGTNAPAAPSRGRAIAPPVGDISVSNMDAATPVIKLDSNARVSIVLKEAPVREVLEMLSRAAGLNLAYAGSTAAANPNDPAGTASKEMTISLNLKNEPVENAFNYVLQISGYEANRVGNTIFAGPKLPDSIRGTMVRTIRMNQVSAEAASGFLTTQGAETQLSRERVQIQTFGEGAAARTVETRTPEILNLRATEGNAPLVLKGLSISTDSRLNSLTLVGPMRKVEMATSMLTRLDARRRQVALNVKIIDINLTNTDDLKSSLSFGTGNGMVGIDNGAAVYNYGGYNPPSATNIANGILSQPVGTIQVPTFGNGNTVIGAPSVFVPAPLGNADATANVGTVDNPFKPGVSSYTPGTVTPGSTTIVNGTTVVTQDTVTPDKYTYSLPGLVQYPSKFLATLQAQIISGNGKILTDPTIVVQEGQNSKIKLTQEVFGGYEISASTRKPIIKNAGLTLDIAVNRIDDNGFVSVGVQPTVSAIGSTTKTVDGDITLIQERTLSSGEIRLRDGQTLILSGIIQESDRTSVTKTPILGDIPILGALFRSTSKTNQRQEVIVLLTPQIMNDGTNQVNYTPGNDARQMIQPR
jgi:type IV pilus assembly protein PilQ